MEVAEGVIAGNITTAMPSHTVCHRYHHTVFTTQNNPRMISVFTDKLVIHQYHIFVLTPHTASPTCSRYIQYNHLLLSDNDLQIDIRYCEDISIVQCHIHIGLYLTLVQLRSVGRMLINHAPARLWFE